MPYLEIVADYELQPGRLGTEVSNLVVVTTRASVSSPPTDQWCWEWVNGRVRTLKF